jgi:putative membrane protein
MLSRKNRNRYLQVLFWGYLLIWALLGIDPVYRDDWFLENILVFVAVPYVVYVHRKMPLSTLSYTLIFIFLVLHSIGSHYTYSEVPAGRMVSDWLGWERNHYDRFVHFLWGFLLTIPIFEILRKKVSRKVRAIFIFACCVIVLVGVLYEFMEWAAAVVVAPEAGTAFLGTQGDEWDAQKDLLLNFSGALASMVFLPWVLPKSVPAQTS